MGGFVWSLIIALLFTLLKLITHSVSQWYSPYNLIVWVVEWQTWRKRIIELLNLTTISSQCRSLLVIKYYVSSDIYYTSFMFNVYKNAFAIFDFSFRPPDKYTLIYQSQIMTFLSTMLLFRRGYVIDFLTHVHPTFGLHSCELKEHTRGPGWQWYAKKNLKMKQAAQDFLALSQIHFHLWSYKQR